MRNLETKLADEKVQGGTDKAIPVPTHLPIKAYGDSGHKTPSTNSCKRLRVAALDFRRKNPATIGGKLGGSQDSC
jgi:hypothetical protein